MSDPVQPTSVIIDGEQWVPADVLRELQRRHDALLTAAATAYAANSKEKAIAMKRLARVISDGC